MDTENEIVVAEKSINLTEHEQSGDESLVPKQIAENKLLCIVCASEEIERTFETSLIDFCQLVKISLPVKTRPHLAGLSTPLCHNCEDKIAGVKRTLQQIEELQHDVRIRCQKLKEQMALTSVTFYGSDLDINSIKETNINVHNAVTFIHHQLLKGMAPSNSSREVTSSVNRKQRERKVLTREMKLENPESEDHVASSIASQRSSFGRIVKRPRYLASEEYENKAPVKFHQAESSDSQNCDVYDPGTIKNESIPSHAGGDGSDAIAAATKNKKRRPFIVNVPLSDPEVSRQISESMKVEIEQKPPKKQAKLSQPQRPLQKVKIIGANGEVLGTTFVKDRNRRKVLNYKPMSKKTEEKAKEKIKCTKCDKSFVDVEKRDQHMKKIHEGKEDYECQQCSLKFAKVRDLLKHKKEKHPPKEVKIAEDGRMLYACEFCDYTFKNRGVLQVHRRKHTGETPYKCDKCNEAFISKGIYEVHVESKHPEIPPLQCEFCDRRFFRHHRLRDHRNNHIKSKPYQCEVCGRSFTQTSYLKYHQRTHKELNLDEFKCEQCDRTFASPANLKLHNETQHQKKYRHHCSICGHGTSHLSHMRTHMRSHNGERPFSCPHCSKTFSRGSQLKIHLRTHTGERPYECTTCGKRFTNSSKVRRHELTHLASRAKRPREIIKVTSLAEEVQPATKNEILTDPLSSTTTTAVIIPEIHEENGQQFLKLEEVPASIITGEDEAQPQLITIEQPNGVTYQVISTNDVAATGEPYTEFIVLNGDFSLA